jgi:hypothetical protein
MKRISVLIAFIFSGIIVQAQISNLPDGVGSPIRSGKSKNAAEVDTYYSETWNRGTVNWNNGTNSVNVLMRYNVISKKLEVKAEDKLFEFSAKDVKDFEYSINFFPEVELFRFVRTDIIGFNKGDDFVRILYTGKNTIIEKTEVEIIENASSYVVTETSVKVIKKSKILIKKESENSFKPLRRTVKAFSKEFQDKDVKAIVSRLELNLDKTADLAKLMKNIEI